MTSATSTANSPPASGGTNVPSFDREALIQAHLPKVKYLAERMAAKLPPSVERDDLYGAGVIGLLDAVERFDPARGIAFTTFAEMRIRGAILDSLRALDWVSRTVRRRARELQAVYQTIEKERGRPATEEEVAAHLKISLAELHELLQEFRGLTITKIEDQIQDNNNGINPLDSLPDPKASPLDKYEETQKREILAKSIDKLPQRERQVIALYYLEELTMKEIGAVLGVTESRVSQLRTQAILRLRQSISGSGS
jgi:RNA polymerase sigma factor for flagellar operon FliA